MTLVAQHFWVIGLLITCAAWAWGHQRARRHVHGDHVLLRSYPQLARRRLIFSALPWLVMGVGALGGVPTVFEYLRPYNGNPYVLAWFATLVGIWIAGSHWLIARNGAVVVAAQPGLLRIQPTEPEKVAATHMLWLIGGITVVIALCLWDAPGA